MTSEAIKQHRKIAKGLNCWSMLLTTLSECEEPRQACAFPRHLCAVGFLIPVQESDRPKAIMLGDTLRTRRQRRLRPSHQGQKKAEDEKYAHKQMLVRNEVFGIHPAGGFGSLRKIATAQPPDSPPASRPQSADRCP
jgi:hypothetical protein